jgi:hypothetical protein
MLMTIANTYAMIWAESRMRKRGETMNATAQITVRTGRSDQGGFDWARMECADMSEHALFMLGEELASVGGLQRMGGYEIVHPYVIGKLGLSFTAAQLEELIANSKRLAAERAERQRLGLVKCACGHTVAKRAVMNTSSGTSCADCYDRMSN